jgi:hypothetical protein
MRRLHPRRFPILDLMLLGFLALLKFSGVGSFTPLVAQYREITNHSINLVR